MIGDFSNEYFFLSNFYLCPVEYDGVLYSSAEAAFQAAKVYNTMDRVQFLHLNPGEAKRLGRRVKLRPDWERIKTRVMYDVIKDKFTRHKDLQAKLLETGNEELVEGNNWNDTYWGMCEGVGSNMLGKILMLVREELRW